MCSQPQLFSALWTPIPKHVQLGVLNQVCSRLTSSFSQTSSPLLLPIWVTAPPQICSATQTGNLGVTLADLLCLHRILRPPSTPDSAHPANSPLESRPRPSRRLPHSSPCLLPSTLLSWSPNWGAHLANVFIWYISSLRYVRTGHSLPEFF